MKKVFVSEKCPVCDTGEWLPKSDDVYIFRHGRKEYRIEGLHYAVCNECGTRGYLPEQRKANQLMISNYQEGIKGYVSPSDVLLLREKYLLTQEQASQIFGGGSQGFSKWERGLTIPAGPTARLIKLALKSSEIMRELAMESGVQLAEPISPPKVQPTIIVFRQHHISTGDADDFFGNYAASNEDEQDEFSWPPVARRERRRPSACLN